MKYMQGMVIFLRMKICIIILWVVCGIIQLVKQKILMIVC